MAYASPLEARIAKKTTRAILDYGMIEDGDRIMVGLSGGKDSWALLQMLDVLRQRAPIEFSIVAVNVDSGYEAYRHDLIRSTCEARGWELRVEHTSIGEVLDDLLDADATPCSLCARLRRGVLYRIASELGATKIALGHHADDFIETLLINVFFAGAIKAMPARLVSDDRRHVVIRPFVYVSEEEARLYTKACGLPVVGCCCPVCGDLGLQRQRMKRLLAELEREHPGVKASLLKSLANVHPRHLLDRRLTPERSCVEHVERAHAGSQAQKGAGTCSTTQVSRRVNPPASLDSAAGPASLGDRVNDEQADQDEGRRAGVRRFIPLTITPAATGDGSADRSAATPAE